MVSRCEPCTLMAFHMATVVVVISCEQTTGCSEYLYMYSVYSLAKLDPAVSRRHGRIPHI